MKGTILTFILLIFASIGHAQSSDISGDWKGQVTILGQNRSFKTHFEKHNGRYNGTFIVQNHSFPFKKINVTKDDSVFLYIVKGMNAKTHFKGLLQNDSLITGKMVQRGRTFKFKLTRYKPHQTAKAESTKQNPSEPVPYHHKDLIIQVNDSIQIGGTLTWPKNNPANQLVITLSGSGAQNRDEEIYGFKIFGTIANYLTRHSVAVFRHDDRGVGESTGSIANATLSMLASDVESIINYFSREHNSIPSFSDIILLGHSKGGMIAGRVASGSNAVDKLILMSSPGIPMSKILVFELTRNIKKRPLTKEQKQGQIMALKNMKTVVVNDGNVKKVKENYYKQVLNDLKTLPDSVQTLIKNEAHSSNLKTTAKRITTIRLRPFKFFKKISMLTYNPASDLKTLDIPVLVLFGGKDVQVTVDMNKKPLKQALEKAGIPYKIKVFPNANHLYQKSETGLATEYRTLPDKFVKGFLPTITRWIKKNNY